MVYLTRKSSYFNRRIDIIRSMLYVCVGANIKQMIEVLGNNVT